MGGVFRLLLHSASTALVLHTFSAVGIGALIIGEAEPLLHLNL